MQFKLKNKDKEIIKFNLRESERIKILFRLYELLEQLTYYCEEDRETYIEKANQINQFDDREKMARESMQSTTRYKDNVNYFIYTN